MNKFLTDLAAHVGADSVALKWRGYWHNEDSRFQVRLGFIDESCVHRWKSHTGTGPTAEAAMSAAIAQMEAA